MLLSVAMSWMVYILLYLMIFGAAFFVFRALLRRGRRMRTGELTGITVLFGLTGAAFLGLAVSLGIWLSSYCSTVYVIHQASPAEQTLSTFYMFGAGVRYRFQNGPEQWAKNSAHWIIINDSDNDVRLHSLVYGNRYVSTIPSGEYRITPRAIYQSESVAAINYFGRIEPPQRLESSEWEEHRTWLEYTENR
jgi:hypothetical protein